MHISEQTKLEPLVSIIIITYNSAQWVLETLESAKAQTYQNIELIVSDDCSTDETINLCKGWIHQNKDRFLNAELITSSNNSGTVKNCNRSLKKAKGKWLKIIAGDDILLENCVEDLMNYCLQNPSCKIVFGRCNILSDGIISPYPTLAIESAKKGDQRKLVYYGSGLPSPSGFISNDLLNNFHGFDETYTFMEDVPFWIKLVDHDIEIHFIKNVVVNYRRHGNNISASDNKEYFVNEHFFKDNERLILEELIPYLYKHFHFGQVIHYYNYLLINKIILSLGNKSNLLSKTLNLLIVKTTIKRGINKLKML